MIGKKIFFLVSRQVKKKKLHRYFFNLSVKTRDFFFSGGNLLKNFIRFHTLKNQNFSPLPLKAYVAHHPLAVIT